MHTTPSLQALAFFLSSSASVQALVVRKSESPAQYVHSGALRGAVLDRRQNSDPEVLDCPDNRYQEFLEHNPADRIVTFCNEWLGIGPATTVVEVTPTLTITTSAGVTTSYTTTQRVITTKTVTATATTTRAPAERRAANIAAIAEDVIHSVIESGSVTATTSRSPQRVQAESGLANACSCKMVDPTATVTSSFTLPPTYTTVGERKVYVIRRTDTKVFTSTTTVTQTAKTSSATPSGTGASVASASITAAPAVTRLTGSDAPASRSSGSDSAIVTALPFSCPGDAGKRVDQVVRGYRLEYLVMCDTQVITQDRIGFPIAVDSETACAARCSLVNAQSGQDTCKAASFEAYTDGKPGGSCTLSGSEPEYVDRPGSVTVVHTGTFANGDECRGLNSSASRTSVDTSALIASITAAPFSLSTPGLVTESANGGVFQTYVSANSTDANGFVHWSWYEVSASSSFWWAVYSTSWECTATLTRTIVTLPSEPVTITSVLVTTIINGDVTTIISGTSTEFITNGGGGVAPPTLVPASTTNANGEFTTFFSLATRTSTGRDGIIPPTAAPSSSRVAGNATVTFSTELFFSTGSAGVVAPSSVISSGEAVTRVSTGGAQISTSGSAFASKSDGSAGVVPPRSTLGGSAGFTSSRSTFAAQSTGLSGVIPPAINTAIRSSSRPIQDSTKLTILTGSLAVTVSGSNVIASSTRDSGIIPPGPSANVSIATSKSVVSGGLVFSTSGSTLASGSTRDSGIIPPNPTGRTVTVTRTVTSGATSLVTSDGTIVFASTGGSGIIPPGPSGDNSVGVKVSVTSGSASFAASGSTFTSTGTGNSGVIPPPSTGSSMHPVSSGGSVKFSSSSGTAVRISGSNSGIVPPLTRDVTVTVTTTVAPSPPTSIGNLTIIGGSNSVTVQQSTAVGFSTGSNGIIPPSVTSAPVSNITSTGPPFTNTDGLRSGSFSVSTSSAFRSSMASSGVIVPSSNGSMTVPPTSKPTLSLNTTSTGPPFTNTDNLRSGSFSVSTSSAFRSSMASSGVIVPSSNGSMTVPPTSKPTLSLNTTSTGPPFTNTDNLRSGSFSLSSSIRSNTTRSGTGGSGSVITGTPQRTTLVVLTTTVILPSTRVNASSSATPPSSLTLPAGSSSRLPTPSSNSTTRFPTAASSSSPPSSINSTTSAVPSSSSDIITLVSNTTSFVPPFSNSTTIQTGTLTSLSNTKIPSVTPSPSLNVTSSMLLPTSNSSIASVTPSPSLNVTSSAFFPTDNSSIPSVTPSRSLNITVSSFRPTGNSSIPSATPTISLSSITPLSICPTAPVVVTVTSVETSIQIQVSTLVQTVTVVQCSTACAGSAISEASSTVPETSSPTPVVISTVSEASSTVSEASSTVSEASSTVSEASSTVSEASSTSSQAEPAASSITPSSEDGPFRQLGEPATPAQIEAACADTENIVINPNFSMTVDSKVPGWSVDETDPAITIGSQPAPVGNGTIAQFKSAIVGRTLTIQQALTLCPGQQYSLSALTRQAHKEAGCTVKFTVGNDTVATNAPAETWLESSSFFTAREGVDGASTDLKIIASCKGFAGIPVSDSEGWMRVEVSGVDISQDKGAKKIKIRGRKRGALEAQRAEEHGYAVVLFEEEQSSK